MKTISQVSLLSGAIVLFLNLIACDSSSGGSQQVSANTTKIETETPMNVLLIISDDLGLQLSSYGDPVIETPNLDALATSGVRFETAYVTQASCSSSRSSIFTGLYPHSNGHYGLTHGSDSSLHPELYDATIPNILHSAGYRTGIVGKRHVRPDDSFNWDVRSDIDGRKVWEMAEFARDFIWDSGSQPFFLVVSYIDPHVGDAGFIDQVDGVPATLIEPSEATLMPFQGVDSQRQRERVASYYNEIKRVDHGVGLLLNDLRASGKADNTLVIFVGDHGPPFERSKATVYEAGLRVPFLVRWPGGSRDSVSTSMVSTVDILPTILDATGASFRPPVALQGHSLRPLLLDEDTPWRFYLAAEFHTHAGPLFPRRTIRDHRFKLIQNIPTCGVPEYIAVDNDIGSAIARQPRYKGTLVREAFARLANPPEFELYDLALDPLEFENRAGELSYSDIVERLQQALQDWREQTSDPFLNQQFLIETCERYADPS